MEGMISLVDRHQRGTETQPGNDRTPQLELRQFVLCALDEEHRYLNLGKVIRARTRRLARRMQRKPKEDQTLDLRQRLDRLGLRGHARAERLAAREEPQRPEQLRRM